MHDVLEDGCPQWADPIRYAFGGKVLDLVQFCTDGLHDAQRPKSPWRERKELYLAHLRAAGGDGVLVSACDKLANLQAILLDLTEIGESVWTRFTGGKDGALWYYAELVEAFGERVPAALEAALRRDLAAVLELAEGRAGWRDLSESADWSAVTTISRMDCLKNSRLLINFESSKQISRIRCTRLARHNSSADSHWPSGR